jgi:hypothetical protein
MSFPKADSARIIELREPSRRTPESGATTAPAACARHSIQELAQMELGGFAEPARNAPRLIDLERRARFGRFGFDAA